jgi:hypothetical protein
MTQDGVETRQMEIVNENEAGTWSLYPGVIRATKARTTYIVQALSSIPDGRYISRVNGFNAPTPLDYRGLEIDTRTYTRGP